MTSTAEFTLAAQLDQAGIPYEREYRFWPPRKWRSDFYVHDGRFGVNALLVEVEGAIGGTSRHLTYTGFTKDCEKYSHAAILGFRVIRATTRQVEEGECLEWIRQALGISTKEAA